MMKQSLLIIILLYCLTIDGQDTIVNHGNFSIETWKKNEEIHEFSKRQLKQNNYSLEDWLKIQTTKNIICFYLAYHFQGVDQVVNYNRLNTEHAHFWDNFMPNPDQKFVLDLRKVEIDYPVDGYQFYEAMLPKFITLRGNHVSHMSVDLLPYQRIYLVGINEDYNILFLSGQFFKNIYHSDFDFTKNTEKTIQEYLNIEFYYHKPLKFEFIKKRGAKYYYKFYSSILNTSYKVTYNLKKNRIKTKTL